MITFTINCLAAIAGVLMVKGGIYMWSGAYAAILEGAKAQNRQTVPMGRILARSRRGSREGLGELE